MGVFLCISRTSPETILRKPTLHNFQGFDHMLGLTSHRQLLFYSSPATLGKPFVVLLADGMYIEETLQNICAITITSYIRLASQVANHDRKHGQTDIERVVPVTVQAYLSRIVLGYRKRNMVHPLNRCFWAPGSRDYRMGNGTNHENSTKPSRFEVNGMTNEDTRHLTMIAPTSSDLSGFHQSGHGGIPLCNVACT